MNKDISDWDDSKVSTKYMYHRVWDILDGPDDLASGLSRLMDELAFNYKIDTGKTIGEVK